MGIPKKTNPSQDLIESLLNDVGTDNEQTRIEAPLPKEQNRSTMGAFVGSSESSDDNTENNIPVRPSIATPNIESVSLTQAEALRLAQDRIDALEKEIDQIRFGYEEVFSASEVVRNRADQSNAKLVKLEKELQESTSNYEKELALLRAGQQNKEQEILTLKNQIEEQEYRIKSDFRKVRIRERELENRLEIVSLEKAALFRAKDETILDLKRKIEGFQTEIENYREKCSELNKVIDAHREQFKRTLRALRLAIGNLESSDEEGVHLKKAD